MITIISKHRSYSVIVCLLATMLLTPLLTNTIFAQDEKLPSGESLIAKYVEVTGGQAAYDKIKNRHMEAKIEIKSVGVVLEASIYTAKPNKLIAKIESDATGIINKGCTGKVAWSMSDMQGPVIEEGASLENQLRDSLFDRFAYWKQAYQSAECVALEKIDGKDCYKVVLTPHPYKSEDAQDEEVSLLTCYFDKESNLVIRIESNIVTAAGTIDVTADLSNYKEVDGITMPFQTQLRLVGQVRNMTVESVKHNVELSKDQFDPPPEIQALIKKNKARD